jgi:hypothetical protein
LSGADESADIKAELNNQYKSASQLACVQASVVYYAALATLAPSSEKKTLSKFRIDIVAGMYVGPEAEESRRGVGHLFIRVVEGDVDSGIEDSLFLDASPDEMLIRFRGTCDTHRGFVGKGITFSPQTGEQLSRAHMILLVPPDLR